MQIEWIELAEFRNYRTLQYNPSGSVNVLTGPNAQGKTNLLEALAFLLTGRSFRTARLGEIPRWGEALSSLAGEICRAEARRRVRRALHQTDGGAWEVEGEGCPWARVIVFGWQDLGILNGGPAARRNFIDGAAGRLYPSHLPTLARFRQILARRNLLLRLRMTGPVIESRLAPWDEQLATTAADLVDHRRRAAAMVQTELSRIYPTLSGEEHKVEIRYRTEVGESGDPETFLAALQRRRREELRRGQTLVGPHRDDLAIELDGVDVRVFGSRGQQRLLALALRLAEILPVKEAVGTTPVLLLDDALSELDPMVRESVLREIRTAEQVFLTTPEPLRTAGAACWEVRDGGITAA